MVEVALRRPVMQPMAVVVEVEEATAEAVVEVEALEMVAVPLAQADPVERPVSVRGVVVVLGQMPLVALVETLAVRVLGPAHALAVVVLEVRPEQEG